MGQRCSVSAPSALKQVNWSTPIPVFHIQEYMELKGRDGKTNNKHSLTKYPLTENPDSHAPWPRWCRHGPESYANERSLPSVARPISHEVTSQAKGLTGGERLVRINWREGEWEEGYPPLCTESENEQKRLFANPEKKGTKKHTLV